MDVARKILGCPCAAGCALALVALGVVVGVGLYFGGSLLLGFVEHSDKHGSLSEVFHSEERFYSIRGDWDCARVPLRFPYSLATLDDDAGITLAKRNTVLLERVTSIGYQGGYFAGVGFPLQGSSNSEVQHWFLISPKGEYLAFDDFARFSAALDDRHLVMFTLYPAGDLLYVFGQTGDCRPLFRIEDLRKPKSAEGDGKACRP